LETNLGAELEPLNDSNAQFHARSARAANPTATHLEPACGAALAPGYAANAVLDGFKEIVFVACGGVTSTLDQVRGWSLSL
jgi:hypothetical protein